VAVELSVEAARELVRTIESILAQAEAEGHLEDSDRSAPKPEHERQVSPIR
jgi:hypothetical protein